MNGNEFLLPNGQRIDILYKYRAWDDYARSMIELGQVYFVAPSKLNDPFDFAIEPTPPRNANYKARKDYLIKGYIRESGGKLGKKKAKEMARKKLKESRGKLYFENNYEDFLDIISRNRDENFGVLSLTEDCLNLLMWSHYADSHKGICVGIKVSALGDRRIPDSSDWRVLAGLHKMEYVSQYPETDVGKTDSFLDIVDKQLSTKCEEWKYEKEWRGLMMTRGKPFCEKLLDSDRIMNLGPDAIERVVLGKRTPDVVAKEISELIRGSNERPQLFRAERKYDSFKLYLEKVQI